MTSILLLGFAAALGAAATVALCEPPTPGAGRPRLKTVGPVSPPPATAPAANGWDGQWYRYAPADKLPVEELTPTSAQVDFFNRPPQLAANAPAPIAFVKPAKPVAVGPVNVVRLRFRDADGADVPALLCTPANRRGPFPLVIALHGLGSNKAQVCGQIAGQLAGRGFATLAPDLPLHGERPGDPRQFLDTRDLRNSFVNARRAVIDVRQCIDLAAARPELDVKAGVTLVGYSMGAIIDSLVGPSDDRVKAMCLMVGGTPDFPPLAAAVPQLAAMQPQLALPHFAGKPVLMLNGKHDGTITPEMGRRLFDAAAEPKQQVWYDAGHFLPAKAYEDAAAWVAKTWDGMKGAAAR